MEGACGIIFLRVLMPLRYNSVFPGSCLCVEIRMSKGTVLFTKMDMLGFKRLCSTNSDVKLFSPTTYGKLDLLS